MRHVAGILTSAALLTGAAFVIWRGIIRPNQHRPYRAEHLGNGLVAVRCTCGDVKVGSATLEAELIAVHQAEIRQHAGEVES